MHTAFLMGNEAIAMGALAAGVNLVCGYPGTPSTEVLETVAKNRGDSVYVEWSVNEKTAMEVAAGASYAGARALVTMKQSLDGKAYLIRLMNNTDSDASTVLHLGDAALAVSFGKYEVKTVRYDGTFSISDRLEI